MLLFPKFCGAQKKYSLEIHLTDTIHQQEYKAIKKQLLSTSVFKDTLSVKRELQQAVLKLQGNGYLASSFDSVKFDSTQCTVFLFLGEKYQWATLDKGNAEAFFSGTGYRPKLFQKKTFHFDQIQKLENTILFNCENNGYPFASIKLDSVSFSENMIHAKLNLDRNRLVKIDSVVLKGEATIAPVYVYNYIGVKPGDLYNESQISRISNRIRELAFLSESKAYEVIFGKDETKLYLYLRNKPASQFDGVIGVLPDNANPGKVNLTADAHLKLQNSLKRGEVIELNWKALPGQTQDLKVHGLYPFLFDTPLGLDGSLAIYKKDTTYIDVIQNIGVQYLFTGNNFIKAFVNNKKSSLLNTTGLENITALPAYADIGTISYGLSGHYEKLDYRFNPRRGVLIDAIASTGNRTITKNSAIPEALYDSVKLNTTQYDFEFSGDYFVPIGQRTAIDFGNKTAWIYSPDIFANELFRIGGLKSLRGFDEESIYASSYSIGKIEYRYLLEQNSFLFTFINGAYYDNRSRNTYIHDTPYGFGAGIDFDTKIGIMSISYALGKQFDNPVYFRNAKVHFGIVNYF